MTFRNRKTWIWTWVPAFTSCETSGKLLTLSLFILVQSTKNRVQFTRWWGARHVYHPGKTWANCTQVLFSRLSPLCPRRSGEEDPMTYLPNLFQPLKVKNSLFNLNTFFQPCKLFSECLFSKEFEMSQIYLRVPLPKSSCLGGFKAT